MKLRQKLAVVLAAATVLTSVPVVTLADTSNYMHNEIYVRDGVTMGYTKTEKVVLNQGQENQTTVTAYTVNGSNEAYAKRYITNLELFPKDTVNLGDKTETFFITLTDGEFSWEAYCAAALNMAGASFGTIETIKNAETFYVDKNGNTIQDITLFDGNVANKGQEPEDAIKNKAVLKLKNTSNGVATFTLQGDKELRVDLTGTWKSANKDYSADPILVPLFVKAKSTQVKVKVDGSESFVTSGTYTLGSDAVDGKELAVTADDAATGIKIDGDEISKIILSEQVLNSITNSENRQVKIELASSSDAEFTGKGITATGKRGFAGKAMDATTGQQVTTNEVAVKAEFEKTGRQNNNEDRQTLIVTLPNWYDQTARGQIELAGIKVIPTDNKTIATGDLKVTVSAVNDDDFMKETELTVGKVAEYGVTATCDKPAAIKAGRSALENDYSAKVVIKENVKDSMTTDRPITICLENGYIISATDVVANSSLKGNETSYNFKSDNYKNFAKEAIETLIKNDKIKLKEDAKGATVKSVEVTADGQVKGFTLENLTKINSKDLNKLEITLPVAAPLSATGEVKVNVSGRTFAQLGSEEAISCKVADITSPVTVEVTAAELKVGLQNQSTAGKIVIKETDKAMLQKGTLIIDTDADQADGIKFQGTPKVEATGVKLGDITLSKDKKYLYIDVERTSSEAGTITVSEMNFTTDRNVPEGSFDVRFYGDALTDEDVKDGNELLWDKAIVKDFIKITTPNTEDIKNGALKAVTSTFALGSTTYTVDGVEKTMDAAAYDKTGRIMVPLRYVAYAFGLEEQNVLYANSTATVIAGEKIIQVKLGDKHIYVNGVAITMDTAAEAKEGRIFVPMSYIAAALGVTPSWDATTKTATFSNVAK